MKSLVSNNFWLSVIGLVVITLNQLGINVSTEDFAVIVEAIQTKELTAIVLAVVGGVMALYNAFKANVITGKFLDVFKHRNWWTSLIMVIGGIFSFTQFGSFPVEEAEQLTNAVFSGNISLIITALWTFGQSIWFIFFKKGDDPITSFAKS